MKKPNNKNIAIIGGGYSGLSAAHEFIKKGYTVQIYEAAPFLGGLASTFDIGEAQVEKFYHHLFLSDQHLIDLLKEFDLYLDWLIKEILNLLLENNPKNKPNHPGLKAK